MESPDRGIEYLQPCFSDVSSSLYSETLPVCLGRVLCQNRVNAKALYPLDELNNAYLCGKQTSERKIAQPDVGPRGVLYMHRFFPPPLLHRLGADPGRAKPLWVVHDRSGHDFVRSTLLVRSPAVPDPFETFGNPYLQVNQV
jgi:hypothetical protein